MKPLAFLLQLALLLCLLHLANTAGCQYFTSSSCTSVGCSWTNGTCVLGNGVCQSGWSYSSSIQECVECAKQPSSSCSSICSTYYFSTTNSQCQSCTNINSNCLTCSETQCFSCLAGFTVDSAHNTECLIDLCKIRFCSTCDSSSTCYLCQTGYNPAINGTICSAAACSIANCLYCYDSAYCVTCQSEYQLTTGGTVCKAICRDKFCKSCSSPSVCTSCLDGYYFNSNTGSCQLLCLVSQCSSCDLSTTCSSCASGYAVDSTYTQCKPICNDANCATCTTPATCTRCNLGYTVTNGACTKAICYIDDCQTCQTTVLCAACNSISTLSADQKTCVQNCLSVVNNCRSCSTSTVCSACKAGYTVSSDGTACNMVCNIANCQTCLTSTLCNYCANGFITANSGTSCAFNCGILNCATCSSTTTCSACNSPFTPSSTNTACILNCSPGFYLNSVTSSCQSCATAKTNCLSCSLSSGNVICSRCQDLFYLTANGDCQSCSRISNCLLCSNAVTCTSCQSGYNLVSSSTGVNCVLPYSCNVSNCKLCSSNNANVCTQCASAYFLADSSNQTCQQIQCLDTQYYDSKTLSCICPFGTFLINKKCAYCSISRCISCNSGGCVACKVGFYVDQGACTKCSKHCSSCTSGTSCLECDYGYGLKDDGTCKKQDDRYSSTTVGNAEAICPAGCSKCTYFQSTIYCTVAKEGYAIDPTGSIVKCSDNCLTCANTNYNVCTSCYGASVLISGLCAGCTDPYALTCPSNIQYSTSCLIGYSPITGTCRKCAANCQSCGQAGANNCDDNSCSPGYVKISGTTNCTKCFSSCASCSINNPSICLSCGDSNYLSNTSSCVSCPSVCQTCTSSTICTSCPQTSILDGNWCYATIPSPCASQTQSTCTSCYYGFNLINGNCVADTTCNGTKTCSVCDKNNYLQGGQCLPCLTDSKICDYCQPASPGDCLYCAAGYFLRKDGSSCRACSSSQAGCALCESAQMCIQALDGYYLDVDLYNSYTGKVKACKTGCATCTSRESCNTCDSDYMKVGTSCFYSKYVQAKLTLNAAPGSDVWFNSNNTPEQNLANAYLKLNQILSSFASISGITDSDRLVLKSLSLGSLQVTVDMASDPAQDLNSFFSQITNNIASLPDFQVVSSSLTVNGATTASSSTANLGLILGIAIPLLVLLVVIIIFMKVYMGDSDEKSTQETEKEIQEIEM